MFDPKVHKVQNYKFFPLYEGLFIGVTSLISLQLVIYFLYFHARAAQDGEIKEGLLRTAKIVASSIDVEAHKKLHSKKMQNDPLYQQSLSPLKKALESDEDIEYIYTTVMKDGKVFFILDAADPGDSDGDGVEDKSLILDSYEDASVELVEALKNKQALTSDKPYEDSWGHHISVFVPFYDTAGEMEGALCIDVSAKRYFERLAPIKTAAQRAAVGAFVMSFFFGLSVWFLRSFSRQMNTSRRRIAKDFEAFFNQKKSSKKELEPKADNKSGDSSK
ncbi:MAG: hypothetical protein NE328_03390 [Lentisphaeraceae bacterium]|nr:hypothetical protein [Lentisphaeraceae bacterium]